MADSCLRGMPLVFTPSGCPEEQAVDRGVQFECACGKSVSELGYERGAASKPGALTTAPCSPIGYIYI